MTHFLALLNVVAATSTKKSSSSVLPLVILVVIAAPGGLFGLLRSRIGRGAPASAPIAQARTVAMALPAATDPAAFAQFRRDPQYRDVHGGGRSDR